MKNYWLDKKVDRLWLEANGVDVEKVRIQLGISSRGIGLVDPRKGTLTRYGKKILKDITPKWEWERSCAPFDFGETK